MIAPSARRKLTLTAVQTRPTPAIAQNSVEFRRAPIPVHRRSPAPFFPLHWHGQAELRSSSTRSSERRSHSRFQRSGWLAPGADSSVGDRDGAIYIMRRVSRISRFQRRKNQDFSSRRNGCNAGLDRNPEFAQNAAKKSPKRPTRVPHSVGQFRPAPRKSPNWPTFHQPRASRVSAADRELALEAIAAASGLFAHPVVGDPRGAFAPADGSDRRANVAPAPFYQ